MSSFVLNFPLFMIILCLVCAAVGTLLPRAAARTVSLSLAALCLAANFCVFLYVYGAGQEFEYRMGHYPHPWGNELKIGILESLFGMAFSLVLFLSLLGGKDPLDRLVEPGKGRFFYVMADLVLVALLVLVYSNDLFTGYVFIEICTLASCGILMIRGNGRTVLASTRYLIFSLTGSGLFLFGVIILYNITGHLLMPDLKEAVGALTASGAYRFPFLASVSLVSIGLAVKSGLFPFHLWMADTYGEAVPTSSAILSGLVTKGYAFFLVRFIFDVTGPDIFWQSGVQNVLFAMGAAGVVMGSVGAIQENNLYRMIAYSSAAQIGYIYMGIGLSADLGLTAALFHILLHALTKPALFLSASRLSARMGGALKFRNLQGAGYYEPAAGVYCTAAAFSMIGLPFTMGFISKYLFGLAAFRASAPKLVLTLLVLAVSTVLNTFYFARTVLRIYNAPKKPPAERQPAKDLPSYIIAGALFALINVAVGILSGPLTDLLGYGLSLF